MFSLGGLGEMELLMEEETFLKVEALMEVKKAEVSSSFISQLIFGSEF